ncbi:sensor histidine kinase [Marinobacterium aestuariivivens]|uniref:histidine kinase n=1 Tax=Marinobacterium aestuariivivens TaxID=1698799 RepID=A0ABW1ZZ84_9GAMM
MLKRALTNLMENAIFYGERCDIRLTEREDIVNIEIRDYGPGIPEAERERVFKPFVRLEPSRSRNTGGSGLGLGIARNIMHAHGGELRLDNHNDGGLVVNLLLPRKNQ